jgi:hypothetical protein
MAPTAATSASSLPQSSPGRLEISRSNFFPRRVNGPIAAHTTLCQSPGQRNATTPLWRRLSLYLSENLHPNAANDIPLHR